MAETTNEKPVEKMKDAAQKAAKAETTSSPNREYRTLLFQASLVLAISAFAVLTYLVKTTPSFPIDLKLTQALQSINSPLFAMLMSLVSWVGYFPQSIIISLLIILPIYALGFHWEALSTLVAGIFSPFLGELVKQLIRRPRPTIDLVHVFRILNSYSFPSGHVMFYVGFFGFIWFLVYTLLKRSIRRTLLLLFLGGLIALVGVSRVYLGQHWPSDVLGAYLLGGVTLVGIIYFYRWGKNRFFVRQPVAPPEPADVKSGYG